jgi:S-adenosyl-L-methionine hydrolase (adenosine-forming)
MPSTQQQSPVITFLSDYGLIDDFVGICHGVILNACPQARIIDLTHGIGRHDVRSGAIVLAEAVPYVPVGVHLAVVDPDVGAQRRAVALRTGDGRRFVGPDNGLLTVAAEAAGGIIEVVDIAHSSFRLRPVSATFHGRDIFAPVAAALAAGADLAGAGDPLDGDEVVRLHMPLARVETDGLVAHAIAFDGFGNVTLDVEHEELTGAGLRLGTQVTVNGQRAHYATTFTDVAAGNLLLYEDAYRTLALAINRGSALEFLDLGLDDEVLIEP